MSTTNTLELVQMLRLRPDKNVTRSKMFIRDPNGGYMKRLDPKTNEEEYYTLKKCLKEGLIDITEYMKIKMEYENYFKQY